MNTSALELTATYTADHKLIKVRFYADESVEIATLGEVSDADQVTAATVGGGNMPGWHLELA